MEIGSEFDLNLGDLQIKNNNVFKYLKEYNSCFFDTGRSAIKSIKIPKGKVLLPNYICESVIECFDKKSIVFYRIDENFNIDVNDLITKLKSVKMLFIMHYFGCVQDRKTLRKIKNICDEKHILVIEDTTHSILSNKSTIGDYMVCSLRKWFPITRGGVVYSKKELKLKSGFNKDTDNSKLYPMVLKNMYLNGLIDSKDLFLDLYKRCENSIDTKKEVLYMSDVSKYILSCFDIKEIKQKRIDNYLYLYRNLKINPINVIKNGECPFVYLIRSEKRNELRKYLIENNIYCAVHWPNCSSNELSITIDNRYSIKEMKYVIKIINKFVGNK